MANVTKMEAVRKALSELGQDAQPVRIQSWVKQKYGLTMSTAHVSNYKTVISRKTSPAGPSRAPVKVMAKKPEPAKPAAKAPVKAAPVQQMEPARLSAVKASGIPLQDIETVKSLVIRVGENNLKSLIDLLS